MKKILISGILALQMAHVAFAQPVKFTIAHALQYRLNQTRNLNEYISQSTLSESARKEVLAYLKQSKLENQVIPYTVASEDVLEIPDWKSKINFRKISEGLIEVNSKTIDTTKIKSLRDLETVLSTKVSRIDLILPKAFAQQQKETLVEKALTALTFPLIAPFLSMRAQTESLRRTLSPRSWLISALRAGRISNYQCNGKAGVKSFRWYQGNPTDFEVRQQDSKSSLISWKNSDGKTCDFLGNEKFEVTDVRLKNWECRLKETKPDALKKTIPFEVVNNCCKEDECHKDVLNAAKGEDPNDPFAHLNPVLPPGSKLALPTGAPVVPPKPRGSGITQ